MISLLLKSSFVLVSLLAFYKIFLEKESFYALNRFYLMACSGLIFLLPFITLPKLIEHQGYLSILIESDQLRDEDISLPTTSFPNKTLAKNTERSAPAIEIPSKKKEQENPIISNQTTENVSTNPFNTALNLPTLSLSDWLIICYFFGLLVLSFNLVAQVFSMLLKIIRNTDKIVDEDGIIVNMDALMEPCSFFHYIFINPSSYDFATYQQIIAHEKIHIKKGHTMDLLLAELAVIVLWFNPFSWLFRKEVEKNIEFQTDALVIKMEPQEKEGYQMNLLKIATYNKPLTVVTNYNQSLIKQRILKMNSKQSTRFSYWKYTFIAPLIFALLLIINKPEMAMALDNLPAMTDLEKTDFPKEEKVLLKPEETISKKENQAKTTTIVTKPATKTTPKQPATEATPKEKISPIIEIIAEEPMANDQSDCAQLLAAAKENNLEKVRNILANFDPQCMPFANWKDYENMELIQEIARQNGEDIKINLESEVILIAFSKGKMIIDMTELVVDQFETENRNVHQDKTTENAQPTYKSETTPSCKKLIQAIRAQDIVAVKNLLETVDVNCVDPNPDYEEIMVGDETWRSRIVATPLVAAAQKGDFEIGKLLIAAGAKIKFHTRHDPAPLMAAAESGNLGFVQFLMDEGADLNELTQGYGTALNSAARGGHKEIVAYLISKGANLDLQNNGQGTALNAAARHGHLEVIKFLVKKGANLDLQTNGQGTALNAAARHGHLETVKLLIDLGADLDKQTNGQGSALNAAARHGHHDVMKLLIEKGADIDANTNGQGSALNAAARHGHLETVEVLLDLGADLNIQNDGQGSALNAAVRHGHKKIVKLLIEKGADIDANTNGQGSALNAAARHGHYKMVELLLDLGADVDVENNGQGAALHAAARHGHYRIAKLLIDKGADVNMMNNGQGTPLMKATKNREYKMVELLLENGADPYKSPRHQESPMRYARGEDNQRLLDLFKKYDGSH